MLYKFNFLKNSRLAILVSLALLIQLIVPFSVAFAGDNDISAYGYNISNNSGWTTGNLGKSYEEGEWVAFQTIITNVNWNVMDRVGVEFDFYNSNTKSRFYDLVRNISVGTTQLPNNMAFPMPGGGAYPLTNDAQINIAQREPDENIFSHFTKINFSDTELEDQINIGTNRFDKTRMFYITKKQVIDAGLGNSSTLVIYFQLHLSRTFMWNNLGKFDTNKDGIKDTKLPLAYAYSDPDSPTYDWGGRVYNKEFLISGGEPYTMLGSAAYPGSSGQSFVYAESETGQIVSGKKTIPLPDVDETKGMISGYKFNDLNGNGVWDKPTEPALSNWEIFLRTDLYAINDLEWSVKTDPNGYFEFPNLPYNLIYELSEELQTGFSQTSPPLGVSLIGVGNSNPSDYELADVETAWWKIPIEIDYLEDRADWGWTVKLAPGNLSQTNANFGNMNSGKIRAFKEDTFENPLSGWEFDLYKWNGTTEDYTDKINGTLTTDSTGYTPYWENLIPGNYKVIEVPKDGWAPINPSSGFRLLSLVAGDELTAEFENEERGKIRAHKEDTLGNDLENWEFKLYKLDVDTDEYVQVGSAKTTGSDGYTTYWEDLAPGTYKLEETSQLGWVPIDPDTGYRIINLLAGQTANGEFTLNFINGVSYHDETMWAYYKGKAIPFNEVAKYLKNWGWTNGPFDVEVGDSITLDLYAGVGGNDISGLDPVGTVEVIFNGDGTVTVIYDTDHEMLSIHFFIGSGEDNMLPKVKNKFTNSPGQFPYDESDGDMSSDGMYFKMTIPFEFLEDIYISAHGVVRIYE